MSRSTNARTSSRREISSASKRKAAASPRLLEEPTAASIPYQRIDRDMSIDGSDSMPQPLRGLNEKKKPEAVGAALAQSRKEKSMDPLHGGDDAAAKAPAKCQHDSSWFTPLLRAGFAVHLKAQATDVVCPHCGKHRRGAVGSKATTLPDTLPSNVIRLIEWQLRANSTAAADGKPSECPSDPDPTAA